jgi:hypothetical protein
VAALTSLLDDASKRAAFGQASRERVLRHFDARSTTSQLVDGLFDAIDRFPAIAGRG